MVEGSRFAPVQILVPRSKANAPDLTSNSPVNFACATSIELNDLNRGYLLKGELGIYLRDPKNGLAQDVPPTIGLL